MSWNWQLQNWPRFYYEPQFLIPYEREFLFRLGNMTAFLKQISEEGYYKFVVEILSDEGLESSRIEGELLDRESLQSSIQKQLGLKAEKKAKPNEQAMAKVLCGVYEHFEEPLGHTMLKEWHATLFKVSHLDDIGHYRTHPEPMQIVSNRYGSPKVFFEAPPSKKLPKEMNKFIKWFNSFKPSDSILGRAAVAHLYFESLHPFEDGNGRIGRLLIEKVLSQGVGRPVVLAISKVLEKRKKEYYQALEKCNRTLNAQPWIEFFAEVLLQAQDDSQQLLNFLMNKTRILSTIKGTVDPRQEKVIQRMFAEGPSGFIGGMSAEKYIALTHVSKATATRDLADLVEKGILTKTGQLRHTRYHLKGTGLCRSYESFV